MRFFLSFFPSFFSFFLGMEGKERNGKGIVASILLMFFSKKQNRRNIADYDCFSQVTFNSIEDYKNIKKDPWYQEHLVGDHEKFADTQRSL